MSNVTQLHKGESDLLYTRILSHITRLKKPEAPKDHQKSLYKRMKEKGNVHDWTARIMHYTANLTLTSIISYFLDL